MSHRELGNKALGSGQFIEAIEHYTKGLEEATDYPEKAKLFNNRSQAHINTEHWTAAKLDATECLMLEPNNEKALYRLAFAESKEKDFASSLFHVTKLLEIDPTNKDAIALKGLLASQTTAISKSSPSKKYTTGSLGKATPSQYDEIIRTVPNTAYPQSIAEFGYHYDALGRLRNIRTGEPFAWLGQKHYDYLGDVIVKDIQRMMMSQFDMVERWLPLQPDGSDAPPTMPRVNVFHTKNLYTCDRLMVLIQGCGAVRAGQWARALCINDSLNTGAVLNYIRDATEKLNCGVLVLNPNLNEIHPDDMKTSQGEEPKDIFEYWLGTPDAEWKAKQRVRGKAMIPIPLNDSQENHTVYCWDNFVKPAQAQDIVIVAHSYGGICNMELIRKRYDEVKARVRAMALTDAVHPIGIHGKSHVRDDPKHVKLLQQLSVNWLGSKLPLDTTLPKKDGCIMLSSGHETHEYTSASAQPSVFAFLEKQLN